MTLPTSSLKRSWIYGALSGCGLFTIVFPLLWADAHKASADVKGLQPTISRDIPDARSAPTVLAQATIQRKSKEGPTGEAGSKDRLAALKSDAEQAVQQLEAGQVEEFIEEYFPVNELRAIREQTTVRHAARDPRLSKQLLKRLATLIALCSKARPVLSQGEGIATFEVALVPEKASEIVKTPEVPKKPAVPAPLPGFGSDLSASLSKAVELLIAKDMEGFVLGFFPLEEAQHLKSSGELADLVYVIQENPQMARVMLQDLQAMQKATPVLTERNTIAEFKFKLKSGPLAANAPVNPQVSGSGTGDTERTLRLQLTDGHWRLFDFASPVRKQVNELVGKKADDTPEGIIVRWERFGSRWRLHALDFIEP